MVRRLKLAKSGTREQLTAHQLANTPGTAGRANVTLRMPHAAGRLHARGRLAHQAGAPAGKEEVADAALFLIIAGVAVLLVMSVFAVIALSPNDAVGTGLAVLDPPVSPPPLPTRPKLLGGGATRRADLGLRELEGHVFWLHSLTSENFHHGNRSWSRIFLCRKTFLASALSQVRVQISTHSDGNFGLGAIPFT